MQIKQIGGLCFVCYSILILCFQFGFYPWMILNQGLAYYDLLVQIMFVSISLSSAWIFGKKWGTAIILSDDSPKSAAKSLGYGIFAGFCTMYVTCFLMFLGTGMYQVLSSGKYLELSQVLLGAVTLSLVISCTFFFFPPRFSILFAFLGLALYLFRLKIRARYE